MPPPDEERSREEKTNSTEIPIQKPDRALTMDHKTGRTNADKSSVHPVVDDAEDILAALPDLEVDLEPGDRTELKRTPSSIIPRRKRRGLFAQLVVGIPEIDDPVQYSRRTKSFIVFIIAIAAIAAPMGYTKYVVLLILARRYTSLLFLMS
jgi:hypothetical protein